ncbi:hypothetical protein ABZ353_09185 [Streptomyces niveus]|uniref:hypothetical protein n=1 Tax=Streptomyces niveus TaxID=193462 RepID=UPI00340688A4
MKFLEDVLTDQHTQNKHDRWLPVSSRNALEGFAALNWVRNIANGYADPELALLLGGFRWLLDMLEYKEPGFALQAALLGMPEAEVVFVFDGSDPDADHDPELHKLCTQAAEAVQEMSSAHAPVVVLTEGRSDVEILEPAFQLLYPHLTDLVRFMDYQTTKAQGGAGTLVTTVHAFAAARIANPVVALFDNDTAASDALRRLKVDALPSNIKILQFPPISLATRYPTLGPPTTDAPEGSLAMADVNGLAGSIELYLGHDVLSLPDGTFRPVQWSSYMGGSKRYHGAITDKGELQDLYKKKLMRAQTDPSVVTEQDWSGVRAILDMVIHAFD